MTTAWRLRATTGVITLAVWMVLVVMALVTGG